MIEMKLSGTGVKEVDHRPTGIRTWHNQLLPVIRTDKTQNVPITRRHIPAQLAIGIDHFCQIHDLVHSGQRFRWVMRHGQHRHFAQIDRPALRIPWAKFRQSGQGQLRVELVGPGNPALSGSATWEAGFGATESELTISRPCVRPLCNASTTSRTPNSVSLAGRQAGSLFFYQRAQN